MKNGYDQADFSCFLKASPINLLEGSLDVKLFERTHRGLILTKAGKSLYLPEKFWPIWEEK
ncbi:MAG: hypothetical protein K2O06_00910 [Acetatifactor sp.]|nr:hypothetical protein [Acetatifactor sp.]